MAEVQVYVLLTVGEEAIVRFPPAGEVRMPAAVIAAGADLPVDELPGRDFFATIEEKDGETILSDFRLVDDPRL